MNLCITGALGHIGSHLIRNLRIPDLQTVHLVDNIATQRYPSLFGLPDNIEFVFHEIDIRSDRMQSIVEDSDALVHLAALTDAETSFDRASEVEETNVRGIEKVAALCAEHGCALLFPSTTSVYGSQSALVDEDCPESDLRPQSPYATSKLAGERLLGELGSSSGLRYTIFRIGTIFGYSVGMRFHTAVNKFIWQAATDQEITVWRTAMSQKRPYCGLRDACNAMNFFIRNSIFNNRIYNIVTANLTVGELVEVIRERVPGLTIAFVDSPIMNQLSYEASNARSLARGVTYQDDLGSRVIEVLRHLQNVHAGVSTTGV
jgi:UDP-glucose 4-epimerase